MSVTRSALGAIIAALFFGFAANAQAQIGKPAAKEVAAINDCAAKYKDDLDEGERRCLFNLVGTPCSKTPEGSTDHGTADCYRLETVIWNDLLNKNFKALLDNLDEQQTVKARAMQRAWVAYRDATCNFYWDKIQGTMANTMIAACEARETARRAMLLDFFNRL